MPVPLVSGSCLCFIFFLSSARRVLVLCPALPHCGSAPLPLPSPLALPHSDVASLDPSLLPLPPLLPIAPLPLFACALASLPARAQTPASRTLTRSPLLPDPLRRYDFRLQRFGASYKEGLDVLTKEHGVKAVLLGTRVGARRSFPSRPAMPLPLARPYPTRAPVLSTRRQATPTRMAWRRLRRQTRGGR